MTVDLSELYAFITRAAHKTYAGGGKYELKPERDGFHELVYTEGDWYYRDSYSGWYQSWGSEVVRYKEVPIWSSNYGGGMKVFSRELTDKTFTFLKQALSVDNKGFASLRGPENLRLGSWEYSYTQEGGVDFFDGYEEIKHQQKVVFSHRIIGGVFINK